MASLEINDRGNKVLYVTNRNEFRVTVKWRVQDFAIILVVQTRNA